MSIALHKWKGLTTVRQTLDSINAWEALRPGMTVLIKPNAVMGGSPKIACTGITTSPLIVREIVRLAREQGAGNVIIAEGSVELPTLKLDTAAAFAWSGIKTVAEEESVALVDMNTGPFRPFTLSDGTEIEISTAVFEADFVINVPVLKTHNQTTTTICLKNLKGCLSMESKKSCHMATDLNRAIAEFNQIIPCHLNVIDALTATEEGPTPTGRDDQVREMGLLMAGKDRLQCDVIGSYLLGYRPENVPHIAHYAQLTDGNLDLDDIPVVGENPRDHKLELEFCSTWLEDLAEKFAVSGLKMPRYGNSLCSACGFNLWAGLFGFCKTHRGKKIEGGAELCTGLEVIPQQDTKHTVLLGKCAIQANKELQDIVKVPGCPPDPTKVVEILTKALVSSDSK